MRLAVLSDIHSNSIALNACVEYIAANNINGIVFLGDYVSDCPNPQATLALMKELNSSYKTWYIKGNREEYFLRHEEGAKDGWSYSSYKGSLLYTYQLLTKEDLETFKSYPDTVVIDIPGTEPIMGVHGSPLSSRELMYPMNKNTNHYLEEIETKYLLCGHTHKQFSYEYKGKLLINPGSVGVAIGVSAAAHFAILEWDDHKWKHEMVCVPYDLKALWNIFEKSDLMKKAYVWPICILKSIEKGVNFGPICAKLAFDLAQADGVEIINYTVPEKYWTEAAKQMQLIS
jgi:predicted phosphodiesterase